MPYCTSCFYSNDFGVSQSKTRTLPYKTWGSGGYHFVSIAHSISSFNCCLQSIYICFENVSRAQTWQCLVFLHDGFVKLFSNSFKFGILLVKKDFVPSLRVITTLLMLSSQCMMFVVNSLLTIYLTGSMKLRSMQTQKCSAIQQVSLCPKDRFTTISFCKSICRLINYVVMSFYVLAWFGLNGLGTGMSIS